MKTKRNWSIFVYLLILVSLSMVFWTLILNNTMTLSSINDFFENDNLLYTNLKQSANTNINKHKYFNNNWSGFIDNISCPDAVTMSWTLSWSTNREIFSTSINLDWEEKICLWDYYWEDVKIFFNNNFSDFEEVLYKNEIVSLNSWVWVSYFSDSDHTLIDFSSSTYMNWDWIDDNFNDDNYSIKSWNLEYPEWIIDDDDIWRKKMIWYIGGENLYRKIFWNTDNTSKIIDDNINNSSGSKIWEVFSGSIYLNVDKDFDLKILKFDKNKYWEYNDLFILDSVLSKSISAGSWYLQYQSGSISLENNITWNEYNFNFRDYDYAILLREASTGIVSYELNWIDLDNWNDIYLSPIDDSSINIIKYLWNEIIIDAYWNFLKKELKLIFEK